MTFALRPDQERVAAYRGGYMAVPAVPGAGKTTVLAYLAADLIAGGYPAPGRILIVTYTNSAVGNFRNRVGDFLEQRGLPRSAGYEVRTIHSLALRIVRERPEAIGWADTFTVADETTLSEILGRLTSGWIARNRPLWESMLKDGISPARRDQAEEQWEERTRSLIRTLIQTFKSRRVSPQAAYTLTRNLPPDSALRWAAEIYTEYQRELAALGAVDFGDLMLGAWQLLNEDAALLARLQQRWTYLFEDEAQDSYRLQEEVLRLLAGPGGNLVRVGDANQAIMGTFTSAEPDLFRRFCGEPGVDLRPLTMAGRSSQDVIDLANELVRWTNHHHPEHDLRSALLPQFIEPVPPDFGPANPRPDRYKIAWRSYPTYGDELYELARMAGAMLGRYPDQTIAVLLPTRAMVGALLEQLQALGIPALTLGVSADPERQRTARDLLAVLEFLAAPHQAGEDALALFGRWLPLNLLPPDDLVLTLAQEMGLTGEELAIAHHLALRLGLFLQDEPGATLLEAAAHARDELQAMGRFADTLYDRKGFKPQPGLVYVTTCHAAKGLEWDTVFVGALTRSEYPAMRTDRVRSELWFLPDDRVNPEALAVAELDALLGATPGADPVTVAKLDVIGERLRLLYVAVTRARENLLLSYHRQDRWEKKAHPTLPFMALKSFIDRRKSQEGE